MDQKKKTLSDTKMTFCGSRTLVKVEGRNGAIFGNVAQLRKDLGAFQVY